MVVEETKHLLDQLLQCSDQGPYNLTLKRSGLENLQKGAMVHVKSRHFSVMIIFTHKIMRKVGVIVVVFLKISK